ncbi:MAG: hypothetical protein EOP11_20480, partial [Proteobacteria bacterium]
MRCEPKSLSFPTLILVALFSLTLSFQANAAPSAAEAEALTQLSDQDGDRDSVLTWFNFQSEEGTAAILKALRAGTLKGEKEIAAFWNLSRILNQDLTPPTSRANIKNYLGEIRAGNSGLRIHAELLAFTPSEDPKKTWSEALALLRAHGILAKQEWRGQRLSAKAPSFKPRFEEKFKIDASYGEALEQLLSIGAEALMAPGNDGGAVEYPASPFDRAREAYRLVARASDSLARSFLAKQLLQRNLLSSERPANAGPANSSEELPAMMWSQRTSMNIGRCGGFSDQLIYRGLDARNLPPVVYPCFQGGDDGKGEVWVDELSTTRANDQEATYHAKVGLEVYGGYKTRGRNENATANVLYTVHGEVEFPRCQGVECASELSLSWAIADAPSVPNEESIVEVRVKSGELERSIPANTTVRMSRRNAPVRLSILMQRSRAHGGHCCKP